MIAAALTSAAQVNSPDNAGYLQRGIMMYDDNNFVGCIDQMTFLKKSLPEGADAEQADFYLAMSAAHLGRIEAVSMLRHFQWRYPTSPLCVRAAMTIGGIEQDKGNYSHALSEYEKINPASLDSDLTADLRYNMAVCYIKTGRLNDAEPLLAKLASSKRYANNALFYQGYIDYCKKDYVTAEKILKSVNTAKAPANMADFYLSQIYFINGNYDKALSTANKLRKAANVDKEYLTEATRIAGESAYHTGDDSRSISLLREYLGMTDSPQPSALYILGLDYYKQADYQKAIDYLSPAAEIDSAMGQSAALYLGQALMHIGDSSTALVPLRQALNMDYDSEVKEMAYYNYAVAQSKGAKQPFGNTVATFENFLTQFPNSRYVPEIREYIVTGYMNDNNYPAALEFIEKIQNPSQKILQAKQHVLYTLGTRQLTAGNAKEAIETLTQASRLSQYDAKIGAETDLWLAEALYAEGRYNDAIVSYENYLKKAPNGAENRPLANYGLGYAHFNNKNYTTAVNNFNDYIKQADRSDAARIADAYNRIGDSYYMTSALDKANDAYVKAQSTNPSAADYALFQQSVIKYHKGDYAGEITILDNLIDKYPSSSLIPTALLNQARAYGMRSAYDKSIDKYRALTQRYPETEQARTGALEMARIYLNSGKNNDAVTIYKEIIRAYPSSEEGRNAAVSLGNIMTENGEYDQYLKFIDSIPGVYIEPNERDEKSYTSAKNDFSRTHHTAALTDYLKNFPEGAYRPDALATLIEVSQQAGNNNAVITYATELVNKYPGNDNFVAALQAKADAEYAIGKGQAALDSYRRLEQAASQAYTVNDARIGIIRSANEVGDNDAIIKAAQNLLASSAITAAQRSEATFALALAQAEEGNEAEAIKLWRQLAKTPDDIFGAKAAVYLAQLEYDNDNYTDAINDINRLFSTSSPHLYWIARAYIIKSDIYRAQGNPSLADQMLQDLKSNYTGTESDIFSMIEDRLQ